MNSNVSARSEIIRSYIFTFSLGAVLYPLIELLYGGKTHFTMVILGGICLAVIHLINRSRKNTSMLLKAMLSALTITLFEFICGILVNLILKMNVWDYSAMKVHLLGQITPLFTFYWFLLSVAGLCLSTAVDRYLTPHLHGNVFFYERKIHGKA